VTTSGGDPTDPQPSGAAGMPPELLEAARGLAEALGSTDVTEAIVEREGARIRIRRSVARAAPPAAGQPASSVAGQPAPGPSAPSEPTGVHVVRAPLAGIFYRAPSPHAEPYVREGDRLEPTSVIGLIEAMKVFNEVSAEASGRVLRFVVEGGAHVQAGDALLHLDPATA
jgi:acetyl-CoA carboxylase biotin carboxyl carrier protein